MFKKTKFNTLPGPLAVWAMDQANQRKLSLAEFFQAAGVSASTMQQVLTDPCNWVSDETTKALANFTGIPYLKLMGLERPEFYTSKQRHLNNPSFMRSHRLHLMLIYDSLPGDIQQKAFIYTQILQEEIKLGIKIL